MPQTPSAVAGSERVEGIASRVRTDAEGSGCVLRFVVETEEGRRVPVEMRGREVLGVLDEGDRVRFAGGPTESGTARPRSIENLTTAATVEVPASGRFDRISGVVGLRDLRAALISALVTVGVGSVVSVFDSGGPSEQTPTGTGQTPTTPTTGPTPREPASSSQWVWWVVVGVVAGAVVLAVGVWFSRRHPAPAGQPAPSPPPRSTRLGARRLAAIAAGVVIGILGVLLLS